MMTRRPRVLFCIAVYNGKRVVPRSLQSASRLDQSVADTDVLILDDASPAPGWSEEVEQLAAGYGFRYYRTPRNLGIPRNVNLGLLAAINGGYDFVVINNSDVIFPANLVTQLVRVAADDNVGSVTAWSNNVSIFSLPNEDPDLHLANQDVVDWLSGSLASHFGDAAMDVPAGISFCILIPTAVVREVGLMDPVFGRGYCEETDWTLRSLARGYRITLAPGVFVYHEGRGSNIEAGLVTNHGTTVPENEEIIDLRYPQFRNQVGAFQSSHLLPKAHKDAIGRIIQDAGRQYGYSVEVGWLPLATRDADYVRVHVTPEGLGPEIEVQFRGFRSVLNVNGFDVAAELRNYFAREPIQVNMLDRGGVSLKVAKGFDPQSLQFVRNYPAKV